ncbi:Zn-dependent alcohol dehydrogenase [Anianabacter salinae]|uniref:Zn-dependent alcohol dehydrogenase n=1 Tax=Anianabacter salinae TaxID=2851023 RepID=UPI00225DEE92|nr:Zn-dependent alcohol dehydrogenase [Anianabacter salinae]MBV0912700.1 Zn-dependent alcohol dehydrogenase [Anianabacter salinae]
MPSTIRAAVCRDFGAPLTIEDITLADPGPNEIEVTLAACAICHSDISLAEGGWGGYLPAVYGHEAAGRITRLGAGVTAYATGDTVLVTFLRNCGTCPSCHGGHPATCETGFDRLSRYTGKDGTPLEQGLGSGCFAEKVVVDTSQIVKIPGTLPMASASTLACGVITGIGAVVNTAGLRPGQSAVVIGAGGVGLNAIQGARLAGASHVIAVDMTEGKLAMAHEFGATAGVLATGEKPWRDAMDIIGRGADHVFVTVGAIQAYDTAMRYLANHGKMTMVGMPHSGQTTSYEPVIAAYTGQQMLGSKMGDVVIQRDIPWMVELYQQGRLKLDELVSATWTLDQINEAIADTRAGGAKRNVIVFE